MFVSTIIPTVNRPTLGRAVASVLDQSFSREEHEVIVVNDSGQPLRDDWSKTPRVRVVDTNRRERSVARNTGAAIAKGRYLHFLDDDDVLLPGALEAFWQVARTNKAVWLHGGWRTVDNSGQLIAEFRPPLDGNVAALLVAGEGLPLQASLLYAEAFFRCGGFDISESVLGVEDRDLGRRLALLGDVARVPALAAEVRVGESTSTTPWAALAQRDRWGREKALLAAHAYRRLSASATSSYWRGRLCRAYVASVVWNLEQFSLATAARRALAALALAGPSALFTGFWSGLRGHSK